MRENHSGKTRWDFDGEAWEALSESEQDAIERYTHEQEAEQRKAFFAGDQEAGKTNAEEAMVERELMRARVKDRIANGLVLSPSEGEIAVPGASWIPALVEYLEAPIDAGAGRTGRRTNVSTRELWTVALGQPAGSLASNRFTLARVLQEIEGWENSGRMYVFPTGRAYGFVRSASSRDAMTARFEVVIPGLTEEDLELLG